MQRNLGSYPFPPHLRRKLSAAGFNTTEDLVNIKPSELSKELSISAEEALELIATVKGGCPETSQNTKQKQGGPITALDMLKRENALPGIITFCEEIDTMLGDGVPLAKITELCGSPGVGKTQLCIQLAVDVQIPAVFGGLEGDAIYVDTEGSFIPQRAADVARAANKHCEQVAEMKDDESQLSGLENFTVEKILSRIHFFRCHNYTELIALVNLLPNFIKENSKVKVVIIDSIAFHFRHDFDDMSLRTRLLNGLAQNLIKLAVGHNLAVVLTNQMTTKINSSHRGGSYLSPALGESWGHAATIRIILFWRNNHRYATLFKSPSKKEMTVPYQITLAGIRSSATQGNSRPEDTEHAAGETGEKNPRKRPKPDDDDDNG